MDDTYEDLSFLEKVRYKINEYEEDFLHLPAWQKIALIAAGSIFVTILFYTFFTVTRLAQIKKVSQTQAPADTSQNTNAAANNSGQDKDFNTQTQTSFETRTTNISNIAPTSQASDGIGGFLQNLLNTQNSKTSNQTSTTTQSQSQSQSGQSSTAQTPSQPYIVNFLNGLLYFKDPQTGQVSPYILSGVNPNDYTWARYTNQTDGYSIEYPTNWTLIKRSYNGHEGLSLYAPSENSGNNYAKQIGLGWSTRYLLPTAGGTEIYYQTSITISNTLGQLYTLGGGDQGGKGTAVLFPHRFGYFGLGGSADTSEFIYVFQHMLSSLTLIK